MELQGVHKQPTYIIKLSERELKEISYALYIVLTETHHHTKLMLELHGQAFEITDPDGIYQAPSPRYPSRS